MRILTGKDIAAAIAKCEPRQIAVAFVGKDWIKFISNPESIEFVILSPTLGTNPNAVIELVNKIGWHKVYFLDELHAKIYLGQRVAIVGSANLTRNGLSGKLLTELCVSLQNPVELAEISRIISDWRKRAEMQYPKENDKKEKLHQLTALWRSAIAHGIAPFPKKGTISFADFELLSTEDFYVVWWQPFEAKYSPDLEKIEGRIDDEVHFAVRDRVKKNTWVLMWRITEKSKPHKGTRPYWLYIHDVFSNGIINTDYDYPQCAIQQNNLKLPPQPFKLTEKVISAFKNVVAEPEMAKYFIQDGAVFSLKRTFKGLPVLISKMRAETV